MGIQDKLLLRNKILGVLIRDARLAAGKSEQTCADFLGVSVSDLIGIEHGERSISLPELEAFAYLVGVPLEYLLGDQLIDRQAPPALPFDELVALRHRVVGVLLQQARQTTGRTVAECAVQVGVPESRIKAYEQGQEPMPLAELEALSEFLQEPLETFVDQDFNPLNRPVEEKPAAESYDQLPDELRGFVLDPLNVNYLRTAYRLSQTSAVQLRGLAEALLEITY